MGLYENAGRLKIAAIVCLALSIGACAKTPGEEGLAGIGAPFPAAPRISRKISAIACSSKATRPI